MIASDLSNSASAAGSSGARRPATAELSLGDVVCGRYCLTRRIARGGSCTVFCAFDELLDETVALKVLMPSDRGQLYTFIRDEALAALRLTHPAIVRVFNYERDPPWELLVMEYVAGPSLGRHVGTQPDERLTPAATVRVGLECLDALAYAHEAGVVHNDLKPSNILIAPNGAIKLCDFGLTVAVAASARSRGDVVGTPAYMSPERIRGETGDARSDLYSLAVTLYAIGNGQLPFSGIGEAQMRAHLRLPPPPSRHLPERLHAVLRRAMSKRPEDRYQTAREMQQALREAAGDSAHEPGAVLVVMPEQRSGASGPVSAVFAAAARPVDVVAEAPPERADSVELEIVIDGDAPVDAAASEPAPRVPMIAIPRRELRSLWGGGVVSVAPLWIDRTPVTIDMYAAFVRASGHAAPADWLGGVPPPSRLDHPVTQVTLDDARAYARWRGCRLPTSLEWEAVARGPHGWRFPWGDAWDATRCHGGGGRTHSTAPVHAHPMGRSADGCLDLVGNVWEWTEPDGGEAQADAQVWVYGGSFRDGCQQAGALPRTRVVATKAYAYLGFRCCSSDGGEQP